MHCHVDIRRKDRDQEHDEANPRKTPACRYQHSKTACDFGQTTHKDEHLRPRQVRRHDRQVALRDAQVIRSCEKKKSTNENPAERAKFVRE